MFYGEYLHTIDPKGRVIMPSRLREELGERFIVTKGLDGCLFVYSLDEWNNFASKLRELPLTDYNARAFGRFFFAGASECEVDKQGRILLQQNLREYAGLDKDVYIIGNSVRVEIWDKQKWDDCKNDENLNGNRLAEQLEKLGMRI